MNCRFIFISDATINDILTFNPIPKSLNVKQIFKLDFDKS